MIKRLQTLALPAAFLAFSALPATGQTTLRQAGAQRALLMGAAADADEFGMPNRLVGTYAATLGAQYSMLEGENAMKWNPIHPSQNAYNFEPGDKLVAFAQQNQIQVRGHNLCWYSSNPAWLTSLAAGAGTTPQTMAGILQDHINNVVGHYKGQVFAWDVVNEAFSDGPGNPLRNSIWYNQPGIGLTDTAYIAQAFRWAHAADPNALLFYNEYGIEAPGSKFNAVYAMAQKFLSQGVPIHGIGIQMHIDTGGYPSSAGLAQVIQQIAALGLQVHITEMDVRVPVDGNGNASPAALQAQAQTYQRILTVCLQNPGCTAFQTWGFTDQYSWIPGFYPGFGAALPFDASYQPKPALNAMITALQTVPPVLNASGIVNAASYQSGGVAPGELVTIFGANFGPSPLAGAQFDSMGLVTSNLAGTQVLFDGMPAPLIYSLAGQVSAIVPFEVAGRTQTAVQYAYNNVPSNTVTVPVVQTAPGIFSADATGAGPGAILNQDYKPNTAANPAAAGNVIQVFATGGGTVVGGASDGAIAAGSGAQSLTTTATVGAATAKVDYSGPAPGLVNGVWQVNLEIPAGLAPGPQPLTIGIGGVTSQTGITVWVR